MSGAAEPIANPIYSELLAIGSKDKSMRTDVLVKYEHLLASPEVRRRGGESTDLAVLAQCAHDALTEAIGQIVTPRRRKIAEAALCLDTCFEGLPIFERVHKLPKTTEKQFKYHRRLAFVEIIESLKRTVTPTVPLSPPDAFYLMPHPDNEGYSFRDIARFCSDVAKLHYAALGMMFAFRLDNELQSQGVHGDYEQVPLIDYLFRAYTTLVHGYRLTSSAFLWIPDFQDPPHPDAELLHTFWENMARYGPLALTRITAEERDALGFYAHRNAMELEARKLYREHWYEVRSKESPTQQMKFPDMATHLASSSGGFLLVMGRNIKFTIPIHAHARRQAHKALASYYEFDEWTPIMNGLSLRHRAEAFFDSESVRLTNKALT